MSTSSKASSSKANVVYQKIVRPPPDVPPALFLGNLVEYLQDHFQLPSNLPMVYEAQKLNDNQEAVLSWDSPLSSCASDTRMDVQVVAIYTNDDDAMPSMAMVVVKKDNPSSSSLAPMMQNLFADSEKRILRALDRGLDTMHDIEFSKDEPPKVQNNIQSVDQAIAAELMEEEDTPKRSPSKSNNNNKVVVDTTAKSVGKQSPGDNTAKSVRKPSASDTTTKSADMPSPVEDYAVAAARQQAAARNGQQKGQKEKKPNQADVTNGDYAVEAARRAAAKRKVKVEPLSSAAPPSSGPPKARKAAKKITPRRFTISTPKQRMAQKQRSQKAVEMKTIGDTKKPLVDGSRRKEMKSAQKRTKETSDKSPPEAAQPLSDKSEKVKTKRSVNLRVHKSDDMATAQAELKEPFETMSEQGTDSTKAKGGNKTATNAFDMDRDAMATAQKVMSEIAEEGVEMSPEELLQDVLKFGEEMDHENTVGTGFVSGAFEKAKELLREQKERRDERLSQRYKEACKPKSGMRPDILVPDDLEEKNTELTAEEELKRIFEAGERLADGRIESSKPDSSTSAMIDTDTKEQEEVDGLIAGEKTVSDYARTLDDELAELEVRINNSPDEELDAPASNPTFDIFSGPEVYNPNVDPETAVNWPGAQPGTKNLRLPKELDEAVKQAQFAADVLTNMKEEKVADDTKYFLREREITSKQVDKLRTVVDEAVQIGLIADPLQYLSEQSRLQMVLDELTSQPNERFRDIISNFKDLLLSDNFVPLVKERLEAMADRDLDARRRGDDNVNEEHVREREILGQLVEYAQLLLKEARALGAELEASQLEIVRSICQVAMDPSHKTEEETSNALSDAVRDMRPLLDDVFVAYLKYAIAEEEGKLARAGLLDDPEHNKWLFVLKIVQQGVYTEISRGINRYIEHIKIVLRMETKVERRMLLSSLIDDMPTMDVRPFVQVVDNIVASLGDSARGEFDGYELGEMTNKLLQLKRDVDELLPPERIQHMSRDADEWAAKQKERLMEQRKITQQRLKAAHQSTEYDEELRRRGEMERFE